MVSGRDTPPPNIIPFVLELGGRPGLTAVRFVRDLFKFEGASREQNIADVWTTISSALQSSICEQLHKAHTPLTPPHMPDAAMPQAEPTQLDAPSMTA